MKAMGISRTVAIVLALLCWASGGMTAIAQYNVSADWSNADNPNGVWSYWVEGSLAKPGTRSGDPFPDPPGPPSIWTAWEGAWTHYGWSKSNGSEQINGLGWDLQMGDVYGHTGDSPMEIRWESPLDGLVNVLGGVWAIRDIGRSNYWEVTLNGTPLLEGHIYDGDPYNRANPDPIDLAIDVVAGDVLAFRAFGGGDYIALTLDIAPASIEVEIDIKPGDDDPSPINPNSAGTIPVAILGSLDFDVSMVVPLTLRLEGLVVRVLPNGKTQCSINDVNGDGYPDLVCHFVNDPAAWAEWMTTAVLTGYLGDGAPIRGSAEIRIVPQEEVADVTTSGDVVQGVPNDGPYNDNGLYDNGWPYDWPLEGNYETPVQAIDNDITTKFLHFKGDTEPTGIRVAPSVGATIVTRLTLTTANDVARRDPTSFELYGSNDGIDGPYTLIASGPIVDFGNPGVEWPRLTENTTPIVFKNAVAYTSYQLLFPTIRTPATAKAMQIAEIELIGVVAR